MRIKADCSQCCSIADFRFYISECGARIPIVLTGAPFVFLKISANYSEAVTFDVSNTTWSYHQSFWKKYRAR
ncbi:MAG TPA: hypothetical protein VF074_22985, partial [Pyrinomonadaceae bacterium]